MTDPTVIPSSESVEVSGGTEYVEVDGGVDVVEIQLASTVEIVDVGTQGPVGPQGPEGAAASVVELDDIGNVTITSNTSGELLVWNGSAWVNNTAAEASLSEVGHTHTESDITDLGSYIESSVALSNNPNVDKSIVLDDDAGFPLGLIAGNNSPSIGDYASMTYFSGHYPGIGGILGFGPGDNVVSLDVFVARNTDGGSSAMAVMNGGLSLTQFMGGDPRAGVGGVQDFVTRGYAETNFVEVAGDTMTGDLLLADGSAADPSLAYSSDDDTGLYRSTTDTLGFAAGGSSAATLSTSLLDVAGNLTVNGSLLTAPTGSWVTKPVPGIAFAGTPDTGLMQANNLMHLVVNGDDTLPARFSIFSYATVNQYLATLNANDNIQFTHTSLIGELVSVSRPAISLDYGGTRTYWSTSQNSNTAMRVMEGTGNTHAVLEVGGLEARNSSGNVFASIDTNGQVLLNLEADTEGLIIQGDGSQTVNLLEVQNSIGTTLTYITAAGALDASGLSVSGTSVSLSGHTHTESDITDLNHVVDVVSNVAQDRILGRVTAGSGDSEELTAAQVRTLINVENGATADQSAAEILAALITVDGAASGLDADLLDGNEASAFALSGHTHAYVDEAGDTMTGQLLIDLGSDTQGVVIQGDASQTADLFKIQTSAAADVFAIEADGDIVLDDDSVGIYFGSSGSSQSIKGNLGHIEIRPATARATYLKNEGGNNALIVGTNVNPFQVRIEGHDATTDEVLVLKGQASQSGNILSVHDSSDTELFSVTSAGYAHAPDGAFGTPSLSFISDTDTGFFSDGSDSLGIALGGTLFGTIETNVAIGVPAFHVGDYAAGPHTANTAFGPAIFDSSGNTKVYLLDYLGTPILQMIDASGDGTQLTMAGTSGATLTAVGSGAAEFSAKQIHASQSLTGASDPVLTIGATDTGFAAGLSDAVTFSQSGTEVFRWSSSGATIPGANVTYDLGASIVRWLTIYGYDLNLSNDITFSSGSGGVIRGQVVDVNDNVGYEYTLVLADAGQYVRLDDGAATPNAVICHVPTNANVAYPVGTVITIRQVAGQVEVRGQGGVTINTPETLLLRAAGSTAQLIKVATNEWDLMGDLEAA